MSELMPIDNFLSGKEDSNLHRKLSTGGRILFESFWKDNPDWVKSEFSNNSDSRGYLGKDLTQEFYADYLSWQLTLPEHKEALDITMEAPEEIGFLTVAQWIKEESSESEHKGVRFHL